VADHGGEHASTCVKKINARVNAGKKISTSIALIVTRYSEKIGSGKKLKNK